MNLDLRHGLLLLALYLPVNGIYAATVNKKFALNDLFKPLTLQANLTSGGNATYNFSGSTADYINYVQLCKATDNTCSSCGAPYVTYKMLTSNNGIPYDTMGTAWNIQAGTVQNYLTNNGYGAGTYYLGLYVQSQDLVCNSNQSYCNTNQDDAGANLCMQAVSDGTSTTLTRLDNGNAVLSKNSTPYLYVNNGTGNTISVCPISTMNTANHTFTCSTSNNTMNTSVSLPKGIALDPISANVYIASQNNSSTASVGCTTGSSNGSLTCSILSNSGTALSGSKGIAIDSTGQNAYIINGGNTLLKCPITSGTLNCSPVTLTGVTLSGASGVAIDSTNSYIYIANTTANNVAACNLSTGACTLGDTTQSAPSYIAINNANKAIYIGTGTGSSMNVCSITSGTTLSCSNAGASNVFHPQGIVLNPAGTLAFIANNGNGHANITVCSVNMAVSPPTFSNCAVYTDTNGTFGTNLQGLAWGNVIGP